MRFAMLSLKAKNLVSLGEHEEAMEMAVQAAEEPNAHYHIVAIAAHVFAAAGKPEQAVEYLNRLRAVRPNYDFEAYSRAFPLFRVEDIEAAKTIFSWR